jgi:hypothetical protein
MASDVEVLFGGNASALNSVIDDVKDKLGEVGGAAKEAGEQGESGFSGFIDKMKEALESITTVQGAQDRHASALRTLAPRRRRLALVVLDPDVGPGVEGGVDGVGQGQRFGDHLSPSRAMRIWPP